jgi:hypothetical protein
LDLNVLQHSLGFEVLEKGSQSHECGVVVCLPEPHGVLLVAYLDGNLGLVLCLCEEDASVVHSPGEVLLDDFGRRLQRGDEERYPVNPVYAWLDLCGIAERQANDILEEDGRARLLYNLVND